MAGRKTDGRRVHQNFKDRPEAIARKAELEIEALNRSAACQLKPTRLTDSQLAEAEAVTQVNATDLRTLSYPDRKTLQAMGSEMTQLNQPQDKIDKFLEKHLHAHP